MTLYTCKDFVLCLGHNAHVIKDYFLNYDECVSNDFVLEGGKPELLKTDIHDWRITFADTGNETLTGGRIKRIERYINEDNL